MKKLFITIAIISLGFCGFSQENIIIISGGYSFANIEDTEYSNQDLDLKGTGWRINGTYEFNSKGGKMSWGISVGYISLVANYDGQYGDAEYKISSVPIYFAPKFMFGKNKFKAFIKGALGTQSAWLKRTGSLGEFTSRDWGFYGGGGAGIMIFVRENMFIVAEYEIAYASNSFYGDGWINSAMGGLGFKF